MQHFQTDLQKEWLSGAAVSVKLIERVPPKLMKMGMASRLPNLSALLAGALIVASTVSLPAKARIFDVRRLGAKGDGETLDTAAIQQALDEAGKAGGTVRIPAGIYLSKPLFFRGK